MGEGTAADGRLGRRDRRGGVLRGGVSRGGRPRRRVPRGWGGVIGMACVCALALTAAAVPLLPPGPVAADAASSPSRPVARQADAADEDCDPRASLRPSDGGPTPALDRIRRRDRLVVGVDQNSYLWGYRNPATGEIVGFDIDLAHAIAEDILGDRDKVVLKTVPTDQRFAQIQAGNVDMVIRSVTITCDRLERVAFSTVYFESGQRLVVPEGSPITEFDDENMAGRRVCADKGSTARDTLEEDDHGARVKEVDNQLDCLVLLQLGEVDAAMTDGTLAAGLEAQDPQVKAVGPLIGSEPYGVAMNKGDTDLVRRVNKVLEEYREGPWETSYQDRLEDYMGESPGPPPARYLD